MQERRTTIRVDRLSRAQYCPSEDLLPRDGRITSLSEQGVGLLAHEVHRVGERVTVSFSLPDEEELLTATGVVRWSDPQSQQGRWHPLGLAWLPLEETTRHRLHTFLSGYAQDVSGRRPVRDRHRRAIVRSLVTGAGTVGGVVIGAFLLGWVMTLQGENNRLGSAIQERNQTIHHLEQRGVQLEQELALSKTQLTSASDAMTHLGQQTQSFERDVQRLHDEVERFQQSYVQLYEEREQLMQRVLDLAKERMLLARRLASVPALRQAIHDAIEARRQNERRQRLPPRHAPQPQDTSLEGNRGYLVWKGQPTAGRSTVWIKVHEPESLLIK